MRGWIAVPAVALALIAVPLSAQRGGAHFSGGHSGFSTRGGGAHFGGGHAGFSGGRSGFSAPSRGFSSSHQFHQPVFGNPGHFSGPRYGSRGFGNCYGCRRFGYGSPWAYNGFYDPYWWWDSGSSYDYDRDRELALADQMNQESLEEQREQQGDQDLFANYPARPPQYAAAAPEPPAKPMPPTVLVFKDESKREIRNYVIVGVTMWSFENNRTERIPLADLDLEATAEANEDRGVEFRLPVASHGQ